MGGLWRFLWSFGGLLPSTLVGTTIVIKASFDDVIVQQIYFEHMDDE